MNETAEKWYQRLDFPKECDDEFRKLLHDKDVAWVDSNRPVEYLLQQKDLGLNFLYFLSRCDAMKVAYEGRGIPEHYFWAAAKGLVWEALYCREIYGILGVSVVQWMDYVVGGNILFRIGRLNYLLETAGEWCEGGEICTGDKIVTVHIPAGEKLDYHACEQSFAEAEAFLSKYFPKHDYQYFVCDSWLLYEGYDAFLKEGSNIAQFRSFFVPYRTEESDAAITFAFARNINRKNIAQYRSRNTFQEKLKQYILKGGKLYVTFGMRKKKGD